MYCSAAQCHARAHAHTPMIDANPFNVRAIVSVCARACACEMQIEYTLLGNMAKTCSVVERVVGRGGDGRMMEWVGRLFARFTSRVYRVVRATSNEHRDSSSTTTPRNTTATKNLNAPAIKYNKIQNTHSCALHLTRASLRISCTRAGLGK